MQNEDGAAASVVVPNREDERDQIFLQACLEALQGRLDNEEEAAPISLHTQIAAVSAIQCMELVRWEQLKAIFAIIFATTTGQHADEQSLQIACAGALCHFGDPARKGIEWKLESVEVGLPNTMEMRLKKMLKLVVAEEGSGS